MLQTSPMPSRYRIIDQIGCGGMSMVYRALDTQSQQEVALKVPHPYLASREDYKQRLIREAKTIAALDHDSIVRIFDFSCDPKPYLVTEFIDGLTLKAFGEKYEIWKVPEIGALIIKEAAVALAYAHSHNVVHRDIKPENMMVSYKGCIKVMDFSIARFNDQESLTMTGAMMGSPAHMAPEVIEGERGDLRADIFSLATVFYWLVTGHLPFAGDNPHTLLKNIVEGRFTPIEELSASVLPSLRLAIEKGMARDPGDRFQDARELAASITDALCEVDAHLSTTDLKTLLSKPESFAEFGTKIRGTALQKAHIKLRAGNMLEGAALLNRVVADDPNNLEALSLIETQRTTPATGPRSWKVLLALPAALATGLFAIWALNDEKLSPPTPLANPEPQVNIATTRPEPELQPQATASAPPSAQRVVASVNTLITVTPYADIWVDGKKVATSVSRLQIPLRVGKHHIVFKHAFAATLERVIEVPHANNTLQVALEKVKPAAIEISSNVDADIAIDGVYKGTTSQSAARPILVGFPDKAPAKKVEIVVSQKGYFPYIAHHALIPGKKHNFSVKLEPEPS